jgi:hypothetical protein
MDAKERVLRRSELYALVWEKAVQRVAVDVGVSDVAVAKACRKHKIPVPERGYWRRKEWGYKVKQPPLPALPNGGDPVIVFHATARATDPGTPEVLSPEEQVEQRPENRIVVPESSEHLARPVRHTRAALRKHRPDTYGLLETRAKDSFCVQVAPASLDRAIRILQALVEAFSVRGHEVLDGDEHGSGLQVRVQGEVLSMSLTERVKQIPHVVTEKEEIRQELNPGWKPPTHDWMPTGTLALRIGNAPGHPHHGRVQDRANDQVEQRLNQFLARLAESARILKAQREAAELQRRKWAADEKARQEAQEKAEVEGARFRRVEHLARLWQRRETLLRFVAAVKERMKEARPELVPAAQAWVDWAEAYLDDHRPTDPLFFEPLLERNAPRFHHFRWTGGYGERDEWLERWRW